MASDLDDLRRQRSALSYLIEDFLVWRERHRARPTREHAAELARAVDWLRSGGVMDATRLPEDRAARDIAGARLLADTMNKACGCWRCGQVASARAPDGHGSILTPEHGFDPYREARSDGREKSAASSCGLAAGEGPGSDDGPEERARNAPRGSSTRSIAEVRP